MSYLLRARAGVLALTAAVLLTTLAPSTPGPSASAAPAAADAARLRTTGDLAITPRVHLGGQAVRFTGTIGGSGRREVHLQLHMNRPGDSWTDVPDSTFRTDATGRFDFLFPAPSMFKISYRVVGDGRATAPYLFSAAPQEITLTTPYGDPAWPFTRVAASRAFTVVADTTPDVRAILGVPPALPGRVILLQQRVGTGWRTVQRGAADADGQASFTVVAPASGTLVLRARQERWTGGKNAIGWFASFPAYFTVGSEGYPGRAAAPAARSTSTRAATTVAARSAARPTAMERYGWGRPLWDYAWDRGQDLDAPPTRGTRLRGRWSATSDGTGRATQFNGGLFLQSKLEHLGYGDLGTTTATMSGAARTTGRWEFRLQGYEWETDGRPYEVRVELVPLGAQLSSCSPEGILVAGATMDRPGLQLGVRARSRDVAWTRTDSRFEIGITPINVAVEVARDHVTWYVDGRPVGSLKGAWSGARLVPRLSLVGVQAEMNGSQLVSDWQRGWTLEHGKQVRSGPALARTSYAASC